MLSLGSAKIPESTVTTKVDIIERLGERAVLLPALIGEALAANDRIKLRLSALQDAATRAQHPEQAARRSRVQATDPVFDDPALAALVAGTRMVGPERVFLPGLATLNAGMQRDLDAMLAPLNTSNGETALPLVARAEALRRAMPPLDAEQLDLREIAALASANRGSHDSIHLLVMDIHKALNRLAAETAVETLDGAQVHALDERDRRAVKAFMLGLHCTAPLAFGHPGLGTTAVRAGGRLTIQNDIGVTDAHVLVIHVEPGGVAITYTDVHRPRAKFFMSLFEKEKVAWDPLAEQRTDGIGDDEIFYLVKGSYRGDGEEAIDRFLSFLGSRIVFLIDWNKARKALQTFVGRNASIDLLKWTATNDYGHRGFLVLGGVDLIFEAVNRVAAGRISYGVRLDEALGSAECTEFLQRVLRDASQGLAAGRTARLIRDEIQADLSRRFETAESSVLTVLVRHLGLTRSLAGAIADLLAAPGLTPQSERQDFAARAKQLEAKADRLTVIARELTTRIHESGMLRAVIDEVENATDALEDGAYFLSLIPDADARLVAVAPLSRLAEIALESVSQLVRAVEAASRLPNGERADAVASLQAIDAVVVAERSADAAERDTFAALMGGTPGDARGFVLGWEIVRKLEEATDHLSHSALSLRDRVMEELSA
jgi:hypothetical protein